jgi:hypothetical protein
MIQTFNPEKVMEVGFIFQVRSDQMVLNGDVLLPAGMNRQHQHLRCGRTDSPC